MQDKSISLFELNNEIKSTLEQKLSASYWIVAEISEIRTNRSGHCYLELIEKNKSSDEIKAKARATIWAYTYRMLKPYFETTTGSELTSGIKVLVNVSVEFHELYGFSLNIKDIDPTYTLGDLERKKQEIIAKLEEEGVIYMNKELSVPILPQKIAVISSETAAGYEDFIKQVNDNLYGYTFYLKLFPAVMQGANSEGSIINALEKIYKYENFFDAVVIIRGGGSQADLSCFNNYWLAYNVTQFPLPIITGIGHERDETIIDIVANSKFKTPTAVAEYLISKVRDAENNLTKLKDSITDNVESIIEENRYRVQQITSNFPNLIYGLIHKKNKEILNISQSTKAVVSNFLFEREKRISNLIVKTERVTSSLIKNLNQDVDYKKTEILNQAKRLVLKNHDKLDLIEQSIKINDPVNILRKGYTQTTINGKIVRTVDDVKKGDKIKTHLIDGILSSEVVEK